MPPSGLDSANSRPSAAMALACAATPVGPGPRVRTAGLLGFPAALVLAEGLVARWPFGGEPLGDVALGQSAGPLAQAARVGGPLLVIGLAATAGVALVQLGRRRLSGLVAAGAVVGLTLAAVAAPDGGGSVRSLSVAGVQGGGHRGLHRLERDPGVVFRAQVDATDTIPRPVDLVVWPENVIDLDGLRLHLPEMRYDLPAGGKRLVQTADGYDATIVDGAVIRRHGADTGARPGRLVRKT